ncbi:MAG: phage major capsid protein [Solobacterium sp.]|jgi:HK97 family phage major capsid protein|nr:phage major capsid protein [Solobacterium sp.]MCH4281521.1 phage major capsid protein [Solobacterium sp.]
MATTVTNEGTKFPAELVSEMFKKANGRSTLAKLSSSKPASFTGNSVMTFQLDGEAAIVGEGMAKPAGSAKLGPVTITPIKFVYQHRVSDEFMKAAEEKQLDYLSAFGDGFAGKIARALDIAAMHGVNPADGAESATVKTKSFDTLVTQTVTYAAATADDNIDDAVLLVQNADGEINGLAMSTAFGSALSKIKANGIAQYPEFRFGANPSAFAGIPSDINGTMAFGGSKDMAIVGDFANAFRWGYADSVPMEIIQYGDPDGLGDLKKMNQVCLRAEAYIGWGILDATSFARIVAAE